VRLQAPTAITLAFLQPESRRGRGTCRAGCVGKWRSHAHHPMITKRGSKILPGQPPPVLHNCTSTAAEQRRRTLQMLETAAPGPGQSQGCPQPLQTACPLPLPPPAPHLSPLQQAVESRGPPVWAIMALSRACSGQELGRNAVGVAQHANRHTHSSAARRPSCCC
jgi:hypothetical protein